MLLKKLAILAEKLDKAGKNKEADLIDMAIEKMAEFDQDDTTDTAGAPLFPTPMDEEPFDAQLEEAGEFEKGLDLSGVEDEELQMALELLRSRCEAEGSDCMDSFEELSSRLLGTSEMPIGGHDEPDSDDATHNPDYDATEEEIAFKYSTPEDDFETDLDDDDLM